MAPRGKGQSAKLVPVQQPPWLHLQKDRKTLRERHPYLEPPYPTCVIPDEVAVAYGMRHIEKLVDVLAQPQLGTKEKSEALELLRDACSNQEAKAQAVQYGSVPTLLTLAEDSDGHVRALACSVLGSVVSLRTGRDALLEEDGVEVVVNCLADSLLEVHDAAARCLEMIGVSPDGAASLRKMSPLVVPALVHHISNPNHAPYPLTVRMSISVLTRIATADPGIDVSLRAKAVEALHACLRANMQQGDSRLLQEALRALTHMCHTFSGKGVVLANGGLEILGSLLSSNTVTIRKLALAAIMGLTLDENAKEELAQLWGQRLVQLLADENEDVATNARHAISSSCEHPFARSIFAAYLTSEQALELFPKKI